MSKKEPNYGNKMILKNSVLSLVYKFAASVISFFLAPALLHVLGNEKYGAWVSLLSLVSWMYYCDVGIGGSMRNRVASSIATNDYEKARQYIGISYASVGLISAVLFIIAFVITNQFDICGFFNIRIIGENLNNCLLIALAFACINFVMSLANNLLYATQRSSTVGLFGVIGQTFFFVMVIGFSITGIQSLLWVATGEGICQFIKNIIQNYYTYKHYPNLKASFKDIDWKYSKDILSLGLMMFVGQIAALVLNATDNLVISKYLSVSDVTPYNFCYKYFNMINTVYIALITPLLSAYTMAYTKKDTLWVTKSLKKNCVLYSFFFAGTIMAMLLFENIAKLWLKKELYYGSLLIITTTIYFLVLMFNHIWSTLLSGVGRVKESTVAVAIGTIINIPVSIFLATTMGFGTAGVVMGSVVSLLPSTIICPLIAIKVIRKMR